MSDKIKEIMGETIDKINGMVDVNSVIGSPIKVSENVVIIPVSRISYGLGTGGSDFGNDQNFGGACGTGVSISPVGFLSICGDNVTFLQVESFSGALDRLISMTPELINKISSAIKNRKKNNSKNAEQCTN